MVYITRKETFNAAHKLYNPNWSEEKNTEVFGKCANKNWHGHNYELYVTVKGEPDTETGMVVNLKELSILVKSLIIERIDHKNLDMDVDFMKGQMSTTENVAKAIFHELKSEIKGCTLHSIEVKETQKNSAEYFGD